MISYTTYWLLSKNFQSEELNSRLKKFYSFQQTVFKKILIGIKYDKLGMSCVLLINLSK